MVNYIYTKQWQFVIFILYTIKEQNNVFYRCFLHDRKLWFIQKNKKIQPTYLVFPPFGSCCSSTSSEKFSLALTVLRQFNDDFELDNLNEMVIVGQQ